jgi:phage gp36-like protein
MALAYTTVDRMLTAFPRIGEVAAVTSAHLHQYAGDAENLINAWAAVRYTLPVSGNVPLLATLATDLAVYRTLALRIFTGEQMNTSPWPDKYKESLNLLERIADGTIPLVNSSGTVLPEGGEAVVGDVWSSKQAYLPTFHEGPWGSQVIDPYKVEDEERARGNFFGWRERLR